MTVQPDRRYRRAPHVLSRSFGGEVLLAAAGHEGVDRLSGGASELWTALDKPRSLPEVISILSDVHEISADMLQPHLDAVLQDLLERRWIEEVPAEPGKARPRRQA